jgi:hypothetical protein
LWAGNPVEYVKELDVGEYWANYSYSYIVTTLGTANMNEFTTWPSNYLLKPATKNDYDPDENELVNAFTAKTMYTGMVKYYA